MPILPMLQNLALEEEKIQRLETAYKETLRALGLVDRTDPIAELVAQKVIEVAQAGVWDPIQISKLAVKALGTAQ